MYSSGTVSRNVPVSTMPWQPWLHQPVIDCPIANLGGGQGDGHHFKQPQATKPGLAGSIRWDALKCSAKALPRAHACCSRLLWRTTVPPSLRELPGWIMPVRYKYNSLINRNLPVELLGHWCPCNVPIVELRVNSSKNELSSIVVGGMAAKPQSYSSRDG